MSEAKIEWLLREIELEKEIFRGLLLTRQKQTLDFETFTSNWTSEAQTCVAELAKTRIPL